MQGATDEPHNFHISFYCGQLIVSGRVAPASWWYEVTKAAHRAEAEQAHRKIRRDDERARMIEESTGFFAEMMDWTQSAEEDDSDELTLIDVSVLPAISSGNGQSGGHTLPVARVPLSSVDTWWIVSGDTIKGTPGFSIGALFPIGD
jgi:hypothetical protein